MKRYRLITTIMIGLLVSTCQTGCVGQTPTEERSTAEYLTEPVTTETAKEPAQTQAATSMPEETSAEETTKQIEVSDAESFQQALWEVKPGDTVLLHEGTYVGHFECLLSGKEDAPITIASYPGETATLSIPKDSDGGAILLEGSQYITIRDLKFSDLQAKDAYGILMTGGEAYITISGCEFEKIQTTAPGTNYEPGGSANAILLYGESEQAIHHVTIENNTVHDNVNGWAENISIAGNCEYIYVKNNQVYDCTNIGIDFYGNAEYCKKQELDQPRHCECTGNVVYNSKSFYAENAGIYVDGAYDILLENNESYHNFYGIEVGSEEWRKYYDEDKRVREITVRQNNLHDNEECGLRLGGWSNDDTTGVVVDCVITQNTFMENGAEIILSKCDGIRFEKNIFTDGTETKNAIEYDDGIDASKIQNITMTD